MSAEVPLDTIDVLLEKYGTDPKVTHWVDANEIWVVPMLNIDGNNQVWTNSKYWRKNTRGCPASGACANGTGVDINRNYPYLWSGCHGSSAGASAEDYHGSSAASEPETQALMALVQSIRPVFDISYHSYSEIVLYPYGCQGVHAPAQALFQDLGSKMAALLPTDDGGHTYQYGTPWETLYGVDGDDMDWMLHEYSVVPFAIEISGRNQGFMPSYSTWRDKTVTKLRAAWELLLDRLDGPGIRGVAHGASGEALANAQVSVTSTAASSTTQQRPVNPDGSFHVVLLPGEYDVTVSASGRTPMSRHVTIGDTRVDLDVLLD
jgi:hypothetical protein